MYYSIFSFFFFMARGKACDDCFFSTGHVWVA